jgi:hypothetical protein
MCLKFSANWALCSFSLSELWITIVLCMWLCIVTYNMWCDCATKPWVICELQVYCACDCVLYHTICGVIVLQNCVSVLWKFNSTWYHSRLTGIVYPPQCICGFCFLPNCLYETGDYRCLPQLVIKYCVVHPPCVSRSWSNWPSISGLPWLFQVFKRWSVVHWDR